jgi:hypothetical protein
MRGEQVRLSLQDCTTAFGLSGELCLAQPMSKLQTGEVSTARARVGFWDVTRMKDRYPRGSDS